MENGLLIVLVIAAAIGIRIWGGSLDKGRIAKYVEDRGGRIVSISWAPFGRGWFGEKNDRIYEVVYYDSNGEQHLATCKTSLLSGVYWTEDRVSHVRADWFEKLPAKNVAGDPVIRRVSTATSAESVEAEVARLRARLAELERRKDS